MRLRTRKPERGIETILVKRVFKSELSVSELENPKEGLKQNLGRYTSREWHRLRTRKPERGIETGLRAPQRTRRNRLRTRKPERGIETMRCPTL